MFPNDHANDNASFHQDRLHRRGNRKYLYGHHGHVMILPILLIKIFIISSLFHESQTFSFSPQSFHNNRYMCRYHQSMTNNKASSVIKSPLHVSCREDISNDELSLNNDEYTLFRENVHDGKRRSFLASLATATVSTSAAILPAHAESYVAPTQDPIPRIVVEPQSITIPLQSTGQGAYLIYFRVESALFRAILDTGSPFLMIPGSCSANTRAKTGCYKQQGISSGLETTYEQFDGFEGEVEWRQAPFSFVNATGSMIVSNPNFVFGVADDGIMSGPGGVFFGLIKNTEKRIRPSFLGQTDVTSFIIDLRGDNQNNKLYGSTGTGISSPVTPSFIASASASVSISAEDNSMNASSYLSSSFSPSLTLSTVPLLTSLSVDYIPMTNDLRKKYGDPVQHYVAKAKSVVINGNPLVPTNRKPIYIIFDTGVSGMVVSKTLYDQRYTEARERREKSLWGDVEVSFESNQMKMKSITAQKPLTTPFDPAGNWKGFNSHVVVIGLSFLDSRKMIVDIDDGRLWVE